MITKTEFFAMMNDENNQMGATARVASYDEGKGKTTLIIRQDGAPNEELSTHRSAAKANEAFSKYSEWLEEWFAGRVA
ncbi:hypothetical protein AAS23_gp67 [Pantoea phage vB_PagS_AAS23]|uniref:Uncharacterized protein n=1 Tax=Pantoea phage vB_PagS_AAS23 TaxID=2499073 RepID=A0A3S9U7Y6_9CAUD|nr:hypothetical protein HOU93_gp67 [Pantoea phage vB_PagS_AAS23]AZS06380.1 hypothetical protein AAS23_gp67 [Pantoea phage vB_PagS_AAS23]